MIVYYSRAKLHIYCQGNYMYDYQRSSQERKARTAEHYGKKIWLSTHPRNFGNHVTLRPTVPPHHRHTNVK